MYFISKVCAAASDDGKSHVLNKKLSHDGMYKFRLIDGDGEICFYGYNDTDDDEAAFDPLDYYGVYYGCESIEYKDEKTGRYKEL